MDAQPSPHAAPTQDPQPLRPTALEWSVAAGLTLVFAPAVAGMAAVWDRVDYASHGYLVPLVALWAASARRAVLPRLPRARDGRGLVALVGALALYAVGLAAGSVFLQGVALVAAVAAAVAYLRGPAWVRSLAFPIGYLLFMVPLPEAWLNPLIVRLQLFVSQAAVGLLNVFGMAVARAGNVIELPGGETLFVAEACSGITSVVTLLPLGVFIAYFTETSLARRAVLVASVVPLAMLGNLLRVVGTVVGATVVGAERATASGVHEWAGIATYVLGCAALLGVGALMRRLAPTSGSAPTAPAPG